MVKREKLYLKNKKKKHLKGTIIWFIIMFSIFIIGYILNKTRNNIFTVIAALFTLPVAQDLVQLIGVWRFKDPDNKISELFESIKGDYNLFHSFLSPDKTQVINFDHIIVTGERIYCIVDEKKDINDIKGLFNQKMKSKGVPIEKINYIELSKVKNMDKLLVEIEKSAKKENRGNLEEYTQLIAQMMM